MSPPTEGMTSIGCARSCLILPTWTTRPAVPLGVRCESCSVESTDLAVQVAGLAPRSAWEPPRWPSVGAHGLSDSCSMPACLLLATKFTRGWVSRRPGDL